MTQEDELKLLQQDELAVTVAAVTGTLFSVVSECMGRGARARTRLCHVPGLMRSLILGIF